MSVTGTIPSLNVQAQDEDVKQGAPKTYKVPMLFDNSDFFEQQS